MDNTEISAIRGLVALRNYNPPTPPSDIFLDPTPSSRKEMHLINNHDVNTMDGIDKSKHIFSTPNSPVVDQYVVPEMSNLTVHDQLPMSRLVSSVGCGNRTIYTKHNNNQPFSLPSINEMLAQRPTPTVRATRSLTFYSSNGSFPRITYVTPYHPYHRKYSAFQPIERGESYRQQRTERYLQHPSHLAGNYLRQQQQQETTRQNNFQQLNIEMLLNPQESRRLIAYLQFCGESELQAFFQTLRQFYRDEYERELKEQKEKIEFVTDACESEDNNGDDEDYVDRSSDNSDSNNTNIESNGKDMRNSKRRSNGNSTDKPRWTIEEKAELFEAIIRYKSLDTMSTFDWAVIGADIGRADKACKDQWRRGVLKMLRDSFNNYDA